MRIKLKDGSYEGFKVYSAEVAKAEPGKPIIAVVSDESVDADGDIIRQGPTEHGRGWLLDGFNKRPRGFWQHDRGGLNLFAPGTRASVKDNVLLLKAEFDLDDPDAARIDGKYRRGVLTEWSVGFKGITMEPNEDGMGLEFFEQELREVSPVNFGSNRNTETLAKNLGLIPAVKIDDQETDALRSAIDDLRDAQEELTARLREVETAAIRDAKDREVMAQERIAGLRDAIGGLVATVAAKQK